MRMVDEWNVSFCSQIPHFFTQTWSSKRVKSRRNRTVTKENRVAGGGKKVHSHHGQPLVMAVPPTILFSLGGFVLTRPRPWSCYGVSILGHFRPS